MAKTWLYVYLYVDAETGEYITKQEVERKYNKKHYKTKIKYNGKFNIKEITYVCRECGKQLGLW